MNKKTAMKQYKYTVLDEDEIFEKTYSFESARNESDIENLVMEAAEDYYWEDRNLWESCYPLSLKVFKEDGGSLGVFRVSYSLMPNFWVYQEEQGMVEDERIEDRKIHERFICDSIILR